MATKKMREDVMKFKEGADGNLYSEAGVEKVFDPTLRESTDENIYSVTITIATPAPATLKQVKALVLDSIAMATFKWTR